MELINVNQNAIQTAIQAVNRSLPILQTACTEFSKLTPHYELKTIQDLLHRLPSAVSQMNDIVKQIIVDNIENPEVGGMPVKKSALMNMVQDVDSTKLFQAINLLYTASDSIKYQLCVYFLLSNNNVSIVDDFVNRITMHYSAYTSNTRQEDFIKKANDFLRAAKALQPYIYYSGLVDLLKKTEFLDYEGGANESFKISERFIGRIK